MTIRHDSPVLRIATVNVNGIRAAARRGGMQWVAQLRPDVLALQEVRAHKEHLRQALDQAGDGPWHVASSVSQQAGRAGVAIVTKSEPLAVREILGDPAGEFARSGRWVEVDLEVDGDPLTVVSVYVPTGQAGTPRQEEKYRFLDAMTRRLAELANRAESGQGQAVVLGDLNIAHQQADLCNWRGNIGKAGFLPEEQAYLDTWFSAGWVDVVRAEVGPGPGPYTWWSWRGSAFDRDVGWRIDYHISTAKLAAAVKAVAIGRAPTYAKRWSDHAPVAIDYSISLA
ncbi:MAG: exodeoxyribonuclease III [Actinomycetota bacterium]